MEAIDKAPACTAWMLGNLFDEGAVVELVNRLELVRLGSYLVNQRLEQRHRSPLLGVPWRAKIRVFGPRSNSFASVSSATPARYQGLTRSPIPNRWSRWPECCGAACTLAPMVLAWFDTAESTASPPRSSGR